MDIDTLSHQHQTGIVVVVSGVVVLSFDALLIRLADSASWDVVFWRGAFMAVTLFFVASFGRQKNAFLLLLSFGWPAFFIAFLQGVGSAFFVLAVSNTTVANAVVLIATAPLFAAVASHFFLKEHVPRQTWLACILVILGVALVFSSSFELRDTAGNIYALFAAMALGGNLTILRRHHHMPRIPVVALSGVIIAVMAFPMSAPFQLSGEVYAVLAVMGGVQMPLALVLITSGTRYLTSPEVSLFLLLETLLGPVWVWLVFGEVVSWETLGGGAIIVATLLVYSWKRLPSPQ